MSSAPTKTDLLHCTPCLADTPEEKAEKTAVHSDIRKFVSEPFRV